MPNLKDAKVGLDIDIPGYHSIVQRGDWFPNMRHPPLVEGNVYTMPFRRIIAFKDPDLILIIATKGDVLFTPSDYKQRHEAWLAEIGNYGFIRGNEISPSVLQDVVDKEIEIFEKVMANYQLLTHSAK